MVIADEIIRANANEIVSLYFDGYSAWQAIELIKSCGGVVECKTANSDAVAPTGNVQMQENA